MEQSFLNMPIKAYLDTFLTVNMNYGADIFLLALDHQKKIAK